MKSVANSPADRRKMYGDKNPVPGLNQSNSSHPKGGGKSRRKSKGY